MKRIENATNWQEMMTGWNDVNDGEMFILDEGSEHEMVGIKYSNDYAILLNCRGKFILAHHYDNCLSIGTASVEYDTIEQAKERLANGWVER